MVSHTARAFFLALCIGPVALAQSAPGAPQKDEPTVRLKTELVQLRLAVADRAGKLVDNLKQDDFELVENGQPQSVSFFSVERVGKASTAPDLALKAAPEKGPDAGARAGLGTRSVVLFVDTLHLGPESLIRAKRHLKQFIDEQITGQDVVAIVTTSASLGILQQFSSDKKILKYAIDKISFFASERTLFTPYLASRVLGEDPRAINVATRIVAAEEMMPAPPIGYVHAKAAEILGFETYKRKATLSTLQAVSERLAQMPGQRIVAVISDGFTLFEDGASADNEGLRRVTSQASRSGVVIYSFEAEGLVAPIEYNASTPSGLGGGDFSLFMSDSQLDRQSNLRTLANDTGGEPYLNRNDMSIWLQKMLDDNRVYYAIAYYPADDSDKKRFRKVSIHVKGHPDYKIRAQKGYLPAEPKMLEAATTPRQKLFQAMLSAIPVTSIPVTCVADFLEHEGDDAQVSLLVHIDADSLLFKQVDQSYQLSCDLAVVIFDASGKLSETHPETLKGTLNPEQYEQAQRSGYRYTDRLRLKPGLYQIRVGVLDAERQTMGTSLAWVDVPELSNGKVALSGIFLGKIQRETPDANGAAAGKQAQQPKMISGPASFKAGDHVLYRLVVYNAEDAGLESVARMKVEILGDGKSVYDGPWQPLSSRTIRKDNKGIEAGGQLQLALEPGVYELRVTVKDGKSKAAQQTVSFEFER